MHDDPSKAFSPIRIDEFPPEAREFYNAARARLGETLKSLVEHEHFHVQIWMAAVQQEFCWSVCAAAIKRPRDGNPTAVVNAISKNIAEALSTWLNSLPIDEVTGRRIYQPEPPTTEPPHARI